MYGRIKDDGSVELLETKFVIHDGLVIANPSEERLRDLGYKPIVKKSGVTAAEGTELTVRYEDSEAYISAWYEPKETSVTDGGSGGENE